jgi:ribose transport system permease protein
MTATTITTSGSSTNFLKKSWGLFKRIPPVYPIFIVIFVTLGFLNPKGYQTMNGIMTFLRPASPLAVLAIGEMVVLALGGFDLSIGAIVTFCVLVSSKFLANDPANLVPNILILLGLGILVGVINGLIVSYLKVPSFITTLGMMMVVRGAALYYVGGAPQGYLTDNFRAFGRNYIQNVPFFSRIPYSFIILIVLAAIAYFIFHKTNFGRFVLSIQVYPESG